LQATPRPRGTPLDDVSRRARRCPTRFPATASHTPARAVFEDRPVAKEEAMYQPKQSSSGPPHGARIVVVALAVLALVPCVSRASELIPSIGVTKSINGDGSAKVSGGLALRGGVLPFLQSEIGVQYRSETRDAGLLKVKQWPVTASLWLTPIPALYAGGGVGYYNTTLEYDQSLGLSNDTSRKFGVHLGGGMRMPLGPTASLDLNGRYVFLDQQRSQLPPNHFNPDYWTGSLGLAFHF
jgi:hypothetical protein